MTATVLLLDHFDSLTYNLVQYLQELDCKVEVLRTDQSLRGRRFPTHVVLSPGPGHPQNVPLFQETIMKWRGRLPILGVCLGHQAIALHCGAEVARNYRQMHGKVSPILHNDHRLFEGLSNPFEACRYHSLTISREDAEKHGLEVIAWTAEGEVMAVAHRTIKNLFGVQFHPESIFTEGGKKLLENFLACE